MCTDDVHYIQRFPWKIWKALRVLSCRLFLDRSNAIRLTQKPSRVSASAGTKDWRKKPSEMGKPLQKNTWSVGFSGTPNGKLTIRGSHYWGSHGDLSMLFFISIQQTEILYRMTCHYWHWDVVLQRKSWSDMWGIFSTRPRSGAEDATLRQRLSGANAWGIPCVTRINWFIKDEWFHSIMLILVVFGCFCFLQRFCVDGSFWCESQEWLGVLETLRVRCGWMYRFFAGGDRGSYISFMKKNSLVNWGFMLLILWPLFPDGFGKIFRCSSTIGASLWREPC